MILCTLLTIASLTTAFIGGASASVIYVPDNYTKIQDAIDNVADGDTIIVRTGNYTENVDVNKTVNLVGEGRDIVTVNAVSIYDHVFAVTADYVNISGFTLIGATNWPRSGIYLSGADYCNISDNNAVNNYYGIYVAGSNNNTLTSNIARLSTYGIYVTSSNNNTLTNNIAYSAGMGIFLWDGFRNNLTNNIAHSNTGNGFSLYMASNNNTLKNNTAYLNDQHGIYLGFGPNNNTLTNNTVYSNGVIGILLSSASDNTLTNNIVYSNNNAGIHLLSSNSNNIINNTANLNKKGICLISSNGNTLANNNASNNYDGIYLDRSDSNTLTDNTLNSNEVYGFYITYSDSNNLIDNTWGDNYYGLYMRYSTDNNLIDNTANMNRYQSIRIYSSNNNAFTNNSASSNNYGLYLDSSVENNFIGNNISNNNYAVFLTYSNGNVLTGNSLLNNTYYGVYLHSSINDHIYNNYLNNTNNVYFYETIHSNNWNTTKTAQTNIVGGPKTGGNFWANPGGTGFSETCNDSDEDGFCDSSYTLATNNTDYLPLSDKYAPLLVYNISLFTGWNQISTPLKPENKNVECVLDNLSGRIIVTTYNTTAGEWYIYDSNSSETATLNEIVAGKGYWLYSENDQNLTIVGYKTKEEIDLYPGWNLVGYNSLTVESVTTALSSLNGSIIVYTYNTSNNNWNIYNSGGLGFLNTLTGMVSGRGYWLRSEYNQTWVM